MSEPSEIFKKLECNDTDVVETARTELYKLFQTVKDSWLINGLYEYYLSSNSLRSMEILANINEPHNKYLFDRLNESLKRQETELKVKALTLLGHIVRKQPTWIYKIYEHPLMKEILNVLKNEEDILVLISALLLVIVLMPIIPSLIAHYLQELFGIFSRLAAWNLGTGAHFDKQMMIHMQISLYALFLRLYGMYPCNFIAFLKSYYKNKNNPVFIHTIQPMLETVRMHPKLVTATKENEISSERWKTSGVQQVIAECEHFYVDVIDKCPHDCCYVSTGFRSRSGTTSSAIPGTPKLSVEQLMNVGPVSSQEDKPFFSPSFAFPNRLPLSSIVPTDIVQSQFMSIGGPEGSSPPEAAIEATPETTPVRDTRPSGVVRSPRVGSSVIRGLTSFSKNRSANTTPTHSQPSSPMRKDASSPFNFPSSSAAMKKDSLTTQRLQKMLSERSQSMDACIESTSGVTPVNVSSPQKIIVSSDPSRRNEPPLSKTDKEEDILQKELISTSTNQSEMLQEEIQDESCKDSPLKEGSPCSQGGLHMPNSKSMNDFAKRVQRMRYYSQNYDRDTTEDSRGSSPSGELSKIKKKNSPSVKESKPLNATEEEVGDGEGNNELSQEHAITRETQTEDSYMPYEHLFLNIFPCLGATDVKHNTLSTTVPVKLFGEKESHHYNVLDRFIEISKDDISNPDVQIQLLLQQLLFERYRRETFSSRNRKLLADAKNVIALEEHNSALKDTVQFQFMDLECLRNKIASIKEEYFEEKKILLQNKKFLEEKVIMLQDTVFKLEAEREKEKHDLFVLKENFDIVDNERQQACAALSGAYAEMNIAKEQAAMGERARAEVERLNKEILLLGELQLKYQEKLALAEKTKEADAQLQMLEISFKEEIRSLKNKADTYKSIMEAYRQRVIDLEGNLSQKDDCISHLKKNLFDVTFEKNDTIKTVDAKYESALSVNRGLEQKMLKLYAKIEVPELPCLQSPETSSCQEVVASASVSGLSTHSTPLSASLASSESNTALISSDVNDMRNLQVLVDRNTGVQDDTGIVDPAGESIEMMQQPSTSGTQEKE
ncbi:hypothetical protein WA026_020917 [Henosepilachna vigintioctopunctata]|uniref:Hamartin n=1 Tax=Henosepilachna vigintioctopunctata TaxID=420089 RepID=A0AAW1UQY8_9CUCU